VQWPFGNQDADKTFSVRWEGFYEARHSGDVSFFVTSVGGVRVYVESFPVIDHWTMEHVNTNGRYCCVDSGQMYSLRVEYQKLATHAWPALIRLDVVTSQGIREQGFSPFFTNPIHILGSPFSIFVMPSAACAAKFAVSHAPLGTVGVPVQIRVQSRDKFGNPTPETSRDLIPWEFLPRDRLTDMSTVSTPLTFWDVTWTPQITSVRPYFALVPRAGLLPGIAATFYSDFGMQTPELSLSVSSPYVSSSIFATTGMPRPYVRLAGLLRSEVSGNATIQFERNSSIQGLRLYVDGKLKLDASSLGREIDKTAFVVLRGKLHQVEIQYWQTSSALLLPWSVQMFDPISSGIMQLFDMSSLFPLVSSIVIQPSKFSPSVSMLSGAGLTVVTAGIAASISIAAYDEFHNRVADFENDIVVLSFSSPNSSKYNGNLTCAKGACKVAFVAYRTPVCVVSLSSSTGLPRYLTISVLPGAPCASLSTIAGFTSLATAGVVSSFVVVSKDNFGNSAQFSDVAVVADVRRFDGAEQHSLLFSAMPSDTQAAFYYRTTSSGMFSVDVRLARASGVSSTFCSTESEPLCSAAISTPTLDFSYNESFKYSSGRFSLTSHSYLKAPVTGVYKFQVLASHAASCLMTLDGDAIINVTFAEVVGVATSGNVFMNAGAMVEMRIEVIQNVLNGYTKLEWKLDEAFALVPSAIFFTIFSSPVTGAALSLKVEPASTCGSQSYAIGSAVSLAEVHSAASFQIISVDHLGNERRSCNDTFVVRLRPSNRLQDVLGSVVSCDLGKYTAVYTPNEQRSEYLLVHNSKSDPLLDPSSFWLDLLVSHAVQGSLSASYYSYSPKSAIYVANTSLSAGDNVPDSVSHIFSVRYAGFIRSTVSGTCTFHVQLPEFTHIQGGSFTVAGKLPVVEELDSQAHVVSVRANELYDVAFTLRSLERFRPVAFNLAAKCNGIAGLVSPSDLFSEHLIQSRTFYGLGLHATYYGIDNNTPIAALSAQIIDWAQSPSLHSPNKQQPSGSAVLTRWGGVVMPPAQSLFTFYLIKSSGSSPVTLALDGKLLIDDHSSATILTATYLMNLYPSYTIELSFALPASRNGSYIQLMWACDPRFLKFSALRNHGVCDASRRIVPAAAFGEAMSHNAVITDDADHFLWNISGHSQSTLLNSVPKARGRGISFNAALKIKVIQAAFPYSKRFLVVTAFNFSAVTNGTAGFPSVYPVIMYDDTNAVLTSDKYFVWHRLKSVGSGPVQYTTQVADTTSYEHIPAFSISRMSTVSGTYVSELYLCDRMSPGLASTWFSQPNWTGKQTQNVTSHFSFVWFHGSVNENFFGAQFSVIWTGFIVPDITEFGILSVSASGKIWIIVNSRTLLNASCANGVSHFQVPLKRVRGVTMQIEIAYSSCPAAPAYLNLMYWSPSYSNATMPSGMLSASCTFVNSTQVVISAHSPCAATSRIVSSRAAAEILTEIPATFSIQLKDQYGNNASLAPSACVDELSCYLDVTIRNETSKEVVLTTTVRPNAPSNNEFPFDVTLTAPGRVCIEASLFSRSGLLATFYSSDSTLSPLFTELATPSFVSLENSLLHPSIVKSVANPSDVSPAGLNSVFSTRWIGQFVPYFSGFHTFTLVTEGSTTIVFDATEVVSVKNPPSAVNRTFVANLFLNRVYDILIEHSGHKSPKVPLSLQLIGPDATLRSLDGPAFAYRYLIGGGCARNIYAVKRSLVPAAELAQVSNVHGSGLSLATAGIATLVSIDVRDRFGPSVDGIIVVRAIALGSQAVSVDFNRATMSCVSCPISVAGVLNNIGDTYVASFMFTRSGDYRIVPSFAQIGGLSATVYSDCDVVDISDLATSWAHPSKCSAKLYSPAAFPAPTEGFEDSFAAVRYSGFLHCISRGAHFIGVKGSGFVSIWVKERILATSQRLGQSASIEAPFQNDIANSFFDILVAHWQDDTAPLSIALTLTDPFGAVSPLTTSSLFSREDAASAKTLVKSAMSYPVASVSSGVLQLQTTHALVSEDPIVLRGVVPAGLAAGVEYYVKDTVPLSSSSLTLSAYPDQSMLLPAQVANASFTVARADVNHLRVRPAQCCAARGKLAEASLPPVQFCGIFYQFELVLSDIYGNACFQKEATGQPYIATLVKGSFHERLPVRVDGSSVKFSYGPLVDSGTYTMTIQYTGPLTTLDGFPASFQVFGGSFCSAKSTIEGSGLSSVSLYASSAISIVNRDMFGNLAIGEFDGLNEEECVPDVAVASTSLVGGVAVEVLVSTAPCACCRYVTPFHGRGPMLAGSGFEVIPLYDADRLTSLNIVNGGQGVGGSGYKLFPPVFILGKPAVFVKLVYTSNLPIFETSSTPDAQSDSAADVTEFVSASPFFDATRGRYVLLYTAKNLPSSGNSAVVSTYAGYHGALLATYYSIQALEGSSIQLSNLDLDGPLATPCLVSPATTTFRGIRATNGASSWVTPDELGCGEGANRTFIYGVRYSAWVNSSISDGVTLSFSSVPAGVYLRAIADTRNVKFMQTELNTWDFQPGPVPLLSARIVPQFSYFHVFIEMRFLASVWEQVPFPTFHNTSCSATRGANCGVYAPYTLAPEHSIITVNKQSLADDESLLPYAAIFLSSTARGASVSLTVSFNPGSAGALALSRGINRVRVAGLKFASFSPSGDATCSNARNSMSVGGVADAQVEGFPSSLSVIFGSATFVSNPGAPIMCEIFGFSNPSILTNSSNSVVVSTYDLAGASIQYKPFVLFPEIP
jgi:hypothetical protein